MRRAVLVMLLAACGGEHPDTGYGAAQPVPATRTCDALCARIADCAVALCNEDTSSHDYDFALQAAMAACQETCAQPDVDDGFTQVQWECIYTESCRAVFEHDTCVAGGTYSCRDLD